jgi:nucleotide-binding universal stress UspA family protein
MIPAPRTAPTAKPVVLVGTDFSEAAGNAMAEARVLSLRLGGSLRLLHVTERTSSGPWQPDGRAVDWLMRANSPAASVETRSGTPWVELARFADECGAALVVVGTHGRTGFQTVALGTTAARLTLLSPRPVLLVSGRPAPRAATDGDAPNPGAAIAPAPPR